MASPARHPTSGRGGGRAWTRLFARAISFLTYFFVSFFSNIEGYLGAASASTP
jgi:hypothetical protein